MAAWAWGADAVIQTLRQSTIATARVGPVLDFGGTAVTTASLTVRLSKAGAALAARSDVTAITHDSDGFYLVTLNATDTNTVGRLDLSITGSGFIPFWVPMAVLSTAVFDQFYGSTGVFTANTTQFGGVAGTFAAGRPEVNTTHWAGTAVGTANVRANVVQVAGQTASAAAGVTFPATIASTTNITAATGVTLAAVTHTGAVIPTVTSVTNAVTAGTVSDKTGYSLTATTGLGNQTANITGNLSGSVGSVTGAVGSVTAAVTAGTVTDKTGYSLATAPPTAAEITTAVLDAFATASDSVQASPTPSTTSFAGSASLSSTDSFYVGSVLMFTSGALDGLARRITGYTGSTRTLTFTAAWPAAPASGATFRILGRID